MSYVHVHKLAVLGDGRYFCQEVFDNFVKKLREKLCLFCFGGSQSRSFARSPPFAPLAFKSASLPDFKPRGANEAMSGRREGSENDLPPRERAFGGEGGQIWLTWGGKNGIGIGH